MPSNLRGTDERQAAAELYHGHQRRLDQIRANENLSPQGRRRQIAVAYVAARDKMAALKQQEQERIQARRTELMRTLFGAPTDVAYQASFRDALDRAGKLENIDQAFTALNQADVTGDTLMVKAIALTASDRGWAPVVQSYGQVHGVGDEITELGALSQADDGRARFERSLAFSLSVPDELAGLGGDIDRIASEPTGEVA